MKCEKCGYEWQARVTNPKSCPLCHAYTLKKADLAQDRAGSTPKTSNVAIKPPQNAA